MRITMDGHAKALAEACRICRRFTPATDLRMAEKSKEELLAVYHLNVDEEPEDVYPKSICGKCRLTAKRAHDRILKGHVFKGKLIQPAQFSDHSSQCSLCERYAAYRSSLLPSPVTVPQSPTMDSVTRPLFPDPGMSSHGRKRIWSVKASLNTVNRSYAKKRVQGATSSLHEFCDEHKESPTDLLFFLLTEELREVQDDRWKEIMGVWKKEHKTTALDCLAMRVTNMQTKNQYKEHYNFWKAKGDSFLAPPHVLNDLEKDFMPGSVRFRLQGEETFYHTPVKRGDKKAMEYGQVSYEPINICDDFDVGLEMAIPNLQAVSWPYRHAVAKTLQELDVEVEHGLLKHGLDPDKNISILTTIKDGVDGMGEVAVMREASNRLLPDKAVRAAFTVLKCEVMKDDEKIILYENPLPNSVTGARPLFEAVADENNKASMQALLESMENEREVMKKKEMEVHISQTKWRRHQLVFYTSMIDEKFDRAEGGLQGSGSRYLCTMCHATRDEARSKLGTFHITRSYDETRTTAKYIATNPDDLQPPELATRAQGVKSSPTLHAEPKKKLLDATHADINMGNFFKKLITCETAKLQTWEITPELKAIHEHAEKKLNDHLREKIGLVPSLMMPGNQARELFDPRNTTTLTELIPTDERKERLGEVLRLFRELRAVYRSHKPKAEEISSYKEKAVRMARMLNEHFEYASWPNYLHKLVEHVQEVLEDPEGPGSIGILSSEGNEAANKLFRELRRRFSRHHNTSDSLRDVLWYHWLYTSPTLRRLAEVRSRKYRCSSCGEVGHSANHCMSKD